MLILLTLFAAPVVAQKSVDSLLIGSWYLTSIKVKGQLTNFSEKNTEITTFYNDLIYQKQNIFFLNDSSIKSHIISHYKVIHKGKIIEYSNTQTILFATSPEQVSLSNKNHIKLLNDTSLILRTHLGKRPALCYYKKAAEISELPDNYVKRNTLCSAKNSDTNYILTNSLDTLKQVRLPLYGYYDLHYFDSIPDTTIEQKEITLSGNIIGFDQSNITFNISRESIDLTNRNGSSMQTNIDYNFLDDIDDKNQRKLDISKLNYIDYTKPSRVIMATSGSVILSASIITTLVIAPLVSVDFKNSTFNKNRYGIMVLSGLAGIVISIPLFVSGQSRAYKLTERNNKIDKDYWYIEKRVKSK